MKINTLGRLYNLAIRTEMRGIVNYDEGYENIIKAYVELVQELANIPDEHIEMVNMVAAEIATALQLDNDIEKSEQL